MTVLLAFFKIMKYQETKYGFDFGAAKIERKCSDDKKGWVCLGIETPKVTLSVYVTKTGKVKIHDQKTRKELLPANAEVSHGDRERQPDTHSAHKLP